MRRAYILAVMLAGLAFAPAALADPPAKTSPSTPFPPALSTATSAFIDHYDETAITDIVTAMGYKVVRSVGLDDDRPFLAFQTDNGVYFATLATACHGEDKARTCFGIQMIVELTPSKNVDGDGVVEELNAKYAAAKFFFIDGRVRISRYLVLDSGVSRDNFKANVDTLLEIAAVVNQEIAQPT